MLWWLTRAARESFWRPVSSLSTRVYSWFCSIGIRRDTIQSIQINNLGRSQEDANHPLPSQNNPTPKPHSVNDKHPNRVRRLLARLHRIQLVIFPMCKTGPCIPSMRARTFTIAKRNLPSLIDINTT